MTRAVFSWRWRIKKGAHPDSFFTRVINLRLATTQH